VRVVVLDLTESDGVNIALRAQEWGHSVKYWLPPNRKQQKLRFGEGMLKRAREWEPLMDSSDLVIMTGNTVQGFPDYMQKFEPYFEQNYPLFGANLRSAKLELDRLEGQKVLEAAGVRVLPYIVVDDLNEAIDYVVKTQEPICIKPWGGEEDKSMTCVTNSPDEAIFHLERWRDQGLQSKLMLQQKAEGTEMGISGWFSPQSGWLRLKEESWEHKRFMNDDLGQNTGEMGTVIRHVADSLLFDRVLKPLTEFLYSIGYIGDCSVNCIIDREGTPWPLEFTARLGWPDFNIRQELIQHDPVVWMQGMLNGQDLFDPSSNVAVGILMAHGDFPVGVDKPEDWSGFPIRGVDESNWPHLHWQQVRMGMEPMIVDGDLRRAPAMVTAGNYVAIATGSGESVSAAADNAYRVADSIRWPSNVMYRTDIGRKLQGDLANLQPLGYALGMRYSDDG
jgi:phosphoribosylamine---glycine ligase